MAASDWMQNQAALCLECARHAFRHCLAKVLHLFTERLPLRLHEIGLNLPEGLDILGFG